jgi:methyl-accepting chemotaxis protein
MATDTTIPQPTARFPVNSALRDPEAYGDRQAAPPAGSTADRTHAADQTAALSEELAGMAETIREVDPRAAERLLDLSRSLLDEQGRIYWSDVDLRRAFNTERIAHAWAVKKEGGYISGLVEIASRVRNVLVLVPLGLTWFAFYEASRAYSRYLELHPEESGTPMLVLWERGFGDQLGVIGRFSTVALIDVFIIAFIMLLTFYSDGRRDKRDDDIAMTAGKFQADLDNALGAATVILSPDRANRTAMLAQHVERLAQRFDRNSQELLNQLQVEHDRLDMVANRREKEFSDFGIFASGMRAGAEETHRLLLDMRQVSQALQASLEDLTSEVSATGDQQRTLLDAVNNLERLTASGIQSDQAVTRQLSDAAQSLADAADRALAGSETAAQAGRIASEAVRSVAEIASQLAESQARVEHALANEADTNSRFAETLRSSLENIFESTREVSELSGAITQLRDGLFHMSNQQQHDLGAVVRKLEDVTASLHAVAGQLPTDEELRSTVAGAVRQELQGQRPPARTGAPPSSGPGRRPERGERFDPTDQAPRDHSALWPAPPRRQG